MASDIDKWRKLGGMGMGGVAPAIEPDYPDQGMSAGGGVIAKGKTAERQGAGADYKGRFGEGAGVPFDPDDPSTWSPGAQRAHAKYATGPTGDPGPMEWWLDQHYKSLGEGKPGWASYGQQSRQMGDQMRNWQIGAMQRGMGYLGQRAEGKDLISKMMMDQAADRLAAQGQSLAASAPGGYNPMLARQAAQQAAGAQQQMAGQAATAGAQEIQAAQDAFMRGAQGIGGVRGQDLMRGAQDIQRYGMDQQQWATEQKLKQNLMRMSQEDRHKMIMLAASQTNPDWWQKYGPMVMQGGGAGLGILASLLASMSDIRAKQAIQPGGGQLDQLFGSLTPSTYEYKNPNQMGAGPGRHVGVMAQDLERSPLGRDLVIDTPQGKMVDYQRAQPMMMAGLARQNERLDGLERQMGGGETRPRGGAGWRVDETDFAGSSPMGGQRSATPIPLPGPTGGQVSATPIPLPSPDIDPMTATPMGGGGTPAALMASMSDRQAKTNVVPPAAGGGDNAAAIIGKALGAGASQLTGQPNYAAQVAKKRQAGIRREMQDAGDRVGFDPMDYPELSLQFDPQFQMSGWADPSMMAMSDKKTKKKLEDARGTIDMLLGHIKQPDFSPEEMGMMARSWENAPPHETVPLRTEQPEAFQGMHAMATGYPGGPTVPEPGMPVVSAAGIAPDLVTLTGGAAPYSEDEEMWRLRQLYESGQVDPAMAQRTMQTMMRPPGMPQQQATATAGMANPSRMKP